MTENGKQYVVPILTIVVGIGWLLNVQGVFPPVDWLWTGGLAVVGILMLVIGTVDKLKGVVGPFLIIASLCSVLRQTETLSIEKEIPVLVIVLGILLIIVNVMNLPTPESMKQNENG
jgi:hypothetical protein